MKKIVKLTETDLTRIVKRVIKENMSNNDLFQQINDVLWNSNASNEEQIAVLKYILNQKEGKGWVTKEKANPLFNGDLTGLEKLVKRTNRLGIDEDFDMNEEAESSNCLLNAGFTRESIGGPMTRRLVYEKTKNGVIYQIGIVGGDTPDKELEIIKNNTRQTCSWSCDPSSNIGIKYYGCKTKNQGPY